MIPMRAILRSTMLKSFSTRSFATGSDSFIDKAKVAGANALLGQFISNPEKFDHNLKDLKITKIGNGSVTCSLRVTKSLQNAYGTLHGGVTATLVDVVGTLALLSIDPTRAGVSVDMNMNFLSPAEDNELIVIDGKVLKTGKRLGFTEVEIRRESDDGLVAVGRHTKAL